MDQTGPQSKFDSWNKETEETMKLKERRTNTMFAFSNNKKQLE